MGWRFAGGRAQQGVQEREEGIPSTAEGALHLMAEGSQRFQFGGVQIRSRGARAFFGLLAFTHTPL
jgi:hypothetical protein